MDFSEIVFWLVGNIEGSFNGLKMAGDYIYEIYQYHILDSRHKFTENYKIWWISYGISCQKHLKFRFKGDPLVIAIILVILTKISLKR